jgi:selenocysteine lyase/cysteine desulfurase
MPPAPITVDEEYWRAIRGQYPLSTSRGYMNTGGLGPAPYSVMDAYTSSLWDLQRISEHGHGQIADVRAKVAAFIGADSNEIAFMRNATEGNATVASGMKLKRGDEIIFESHVHPGGAMAWMTRQKEDGIVVKMFVPDPESAQTNLDRIAALVTPKTRCIQISHITAPTGIHLPAKEIAEFAHSRGIWFHVDGAQSAGAIPVDVRTIGCDSFAACAHKWMGAPHGTGFLYVKHDRLGDIVPTEVGAYSNSDFELPNVFDYVNSAVRYEPGTRDSSSIVGISSAIDFLDVIGMERVQSRGRELARRLQDGIREIDGVSILSPSTDKMGAAITTIKLESMPYDELYRFLAGDEYRLRCRVVSEQGLNALRISTHIFNSPDECDRAIAGVKAAASRKANR